MKKNIKQGYKSFKQIKTETLGEVGTPQRNEYEFELKLEILGEQIKQLRKEQGLTQEMLGQKIGVKKAQISKFENNYTNITVETLVKIFHAFNKKLIIKVDNQSNLIL